MIVLAAAWLILAAPARAQTLSQDCVNEIGLFCRDLEGRALGQCLSENLGSATPRCKDRLKEEGAEGLGGATGLVPGIEGFSSEVEAEDRPFSVVGATEPEITTSLADAALSDSVDNATGTAVTSGHLSVAFSAAMGPRGCDLAGARVTVTIQRKIPYWAPPRSASPGLRDWWVRLSSATMTHEDGHRERWIAAGRDAARDLERMAPALDCAELALFVQSAQDAANADAMRRNIEWDAQTRQGQAQFDEVFGPPPAPGKKDNYGSSSASASEGATDCVGGACVSAAAEAGAASETDADMDGTGEETAGEASERSARIAR